jgi:glycosyltransferase involved in cell wall biosynthesis
MVHGLEQTFLSIVIPAHNERNRLPATLESIHAFLKTQPYTAEIVVVENGSCDGTLEIAQQFTQTIEQLRVFKEEERVKGLAVRRGMLEARGQYRFICDADLSMPIEQVNRFLPPALPDVQIAIGSRETSGAVRYNEPTYRHLIGRGFNSLVRLLALPKLHDTQCGFKCFRGDIADDLFSHQTLTGMSFDVEVLYIACRRGIPIVEVPIDWYFNADSRVRLVEDSLRMGADLLAIRRNARQGLYENGRQASPASDSPCQ